LDASDRVQLSKLIPKKGIAYRACPFVYSQQPKRLWLALPPAAGMVLADKSVAERNDCDDRVAFHASLAFAAANPI
jgi:hypothetical protein